MKLLSTICALALAVMTSLVVWTRLRSDSTFGDPVPLESPTPVSVHPDRSERGFGVSSAPLARSLQGPEKNITALEQQVMALRQEQEQLRAQIAELNRDIMQLEFRVDTHSESFRPLPSEDGGTPWDTLPYDGPEGLLPNLPR